jgi:outer membrane protein
MRKLFLVLLLTTFVVSHSYAMEKFAYVNVQKIMNESKKGKKLKKEIESSIKNYQKRFENIQKKIENLQKQLESPVLSEKGKEKKKEEIRKLQRQFVQLQMEAEQKLNQKKAQAEKKMVDDLREIVKKYSNKKGIDIVFFGGLQNGILYADKSIDITPDILRIYNISSK